MHCLKSGPLTGPAWLGTASRNELMGDDFENMSEAEVAQGPPFGRFSLVTEDELVELEEKWTSKNPHAQTAWGVNIFRGKHNHVGLFCLHLNTVTSMWVMPCQLKAMVKSGTHFCTSNIVKVSSSRTYLRPFYVTPFNDKIGVLLNVYKIVKVKYRNHNERLRWDAAVSCGTPKH